jgi:hypothetical protein
MEMENGLEEKKSSTLWEYLRRYYTNIRNFDPYKTSIIVFYHYIWQNNKFLIIRWYLLLIFALNLICSFFWSYVVPILIEFLPYVRAFLRLCLICVYFCP